MRSPTQADATTDVGSQYNSWLTISAEPDWIELAIDQVSSWLRSKDHALDVPMSKDATYRIADKTLSVRRHKKGGQDAFRFVMNEGAAGRRFTTVAMFVAGKRDGWMSLRVSNDAGQWVGTPRLASNLLLSPGGFEDGGRAMSPSIWHVRALDEGPSLIDLLVSRRRGAVFVAAAGDGQPDLSVLYAKRLEEWTAPAKGLAHVVYLEPPVARWLRDQHGGVLSVDDWTVRTFRPGINLSTPSTLRMHRTLGLQSLTTSSDGRLRHLFSVFARTVLESQPEPREFVSWTRTFERLDSRDASDALRRVADRASTSRKLLEERRSTRDAADALQAALPPGPAAAAVPPTPAKPLDLVSLELERALAELAGARRTLDRIRTTLFLPDFEEETLEGLLEAATSSDLDQEAAAAGAERIEELEERVAELDAQVERHQQAEWEAREDARDALDQLNRMENAAMLLSRQFAALAAGDDPATVSDANLDEPGPEAGSWQDLAERMPSWESLGVVITADPVIVADMDDIDHDGRSLTLAWRALRAIAGYVRAKRDGVHEGGFKRYLQGQPNGYALYSPDHFATSETKNAMSGDWGKERVFPVPKSIHPDGRLTMQQHLRIGRIRNLDPRIYIHDATTQNGTVVVGYIGPHLTSRMTARLNR